MLDLLVIGAGLAGLSAAITAAKAGWQVRVIAKGMGVTHWHAGTVDVLGYLPATDEPVQRPLATSQTLTRAHPYQLMGAQRLQDNLAAFRGWLNTSGLGYGGATNPDQNLWLPSPVGAARPTWLAPAAQRAGDLSQPEPMLIVGFRGLRDFYPQLIAENLTRQGYTARAAFLPLTLLSDLRDRNPIQLAEALEAPARQTQLASALKKIVHRGERIGLPALLGVNEHANVWAALQSQTGAPIFEIPTLPPSVSGIRLYRALRQQLSDAGGRIETNMEAIGFHADGNQIRWVETATSARPIKHYARHFLLATGGLLGGGFNSDHTGRCWETIFHLPLTITQDRNAWFRHQFLHPQGQPVFTGGVSVNSEFQPIDQNGARYYANLWAAGSVLAATDPIRERSLEGIAVATGVASAQYSMNTTTN